LHRKAGHLDQVAEGRFPAVVLPVRVRRKTHGNIEGRVRLQRTESLKIERQ
jgi:hypothetical protein